MTATLHRWVSTVYLDSDDLNWLPAFQTETLPLEKPYPSILPKALLSYAVWGRLHRLERAEGPHHALLLRYALVQLPLRASGCARLPSVRLGGVFEHPRQLRYTTIRYASKRRFPFIVIITAIRLRSCLRSYVSTTALCCVCIGAGQHSKSDHFVPESVAVLVARACMCTTTCLSYPIFTFITRMAIVDVLYSGTEDDRDRMYVALDRSIYIISTTSVAAQIFRGKLPGGGVSDSPLRLAPLLLVV